MDGKQKAAISGKEFQLIAEQSGIMVFRYYMNERTLHSFCTFSNMHDYEPRFQSNVPDSMIEAGFISDDTQRAYYDFFEKMHQGITHSHVNIKVKVDSDWRWYCGDYHMIYDESGTPLYAFITFFDNTEKRKMEIAFEKWKANLTSSLSNSIVYAEVNLTRDIVEKVDGEPSFIKYRKSGSTLKSFLENARLGKLNEEKNIDFFNFFERGRLINLFSSDVKEDRMDYCIVNADNSSYWIRTIVHMTKYIGSDDIIAFIIFSSIDEEKKELAKLSHLAHHDTLTGLLNREGIAQGVEVQMKEYNPDNLTAMMIADLDNFKQINDYLGHQVGDKVLQKVSKKLNDSFKENDIIGRLGGDEFIVLISRHITLDELEAKAMELLESIQLEHKRNVSISVSIGIAYGHARVTFDKLYKTADIALYTAKKQGKHCFHIINFDTDEGQSYANQKDNSLIPLQTLLNYVDLSQNLNNTMHSKIRTPYQALVENMPSGVVVIEFDHDKESITHCNDWMYRFVGYTKEEMNMMHEDGILIITHPDDKSALREAILSVRNGKDEITVNFRIQHKEGYYKYVSLNATVTERTTTKIIVYGIYADINELMSIQNELHNSQSKLNAILDSIPGGMSIIEIGEHLKITYVGNWIAQYLGYDNGELTQIRKDYEFNTILKSDLPVVYDAVRRVREGCEKINIKYHVYDHKRDAKMLTLSAVVVNRSKDVIILNAISMFDS